MAQGYQGVLWSILWAFLLILFSFEVALFCAFWYILLYPFTLCIRSLSGLTDVFLRGIQLPHFCADSMINRRSFTEAVHSLMPNT